MTKISVVIITYNEERNIARCLEAVQGFADEIVVVDSHSTDATRTICESYGVRFVTEEWRGYSGQKNYGHQLASNDWNLSIDADEVVSEELQQSIAAWKSRPEPVFAKVKRLTNYCGRWIRHCGWYPDSKLRLFDRTCAQWQGEVHERLVIAKDMPVIELRGDLLHYTYHTIDDHMAKANRFSTIGASQLLSKGRKISFLNVVVNPPAKFIRNYIVKLGFLDGYYGYAICRSSAYHTFLKYFKAWHMQRENSRNTRV